MASTLNQLKSSRNYPGIFKSSADPTAAANSSAGYINGMLWVNTVSNAIFMCLDDVVPTWTTVSSGSNAKNNIGVTDPTTTSDSSFGYGVGSIWVNTATDQAYVCVDATPTAAIWKSITGGTKNTAAASAPTLTSDTTLGYSIGSLWWDSATNTQYVATSVNAGAAAWVALSSIKNNFTATAAPTVANDASQGYSVGSRWIDTTTGNVYTATSVAAGAAVWSSGGGAAGTVSATAPASPSAGDLWYNTTNDLTYIYSGTAWIDIVNAGTSGVKNNFTATAAPTAANDSSVAQGYSVGSVWVDTTSNKSYTCVDSTVASAIWSSGGESWVVMTASTTAVSNTGYLVNTSGGPLTLTLPAAPILGDRVEFKDYGSAFATNALTIARNGKTIMGLAVDMTVSTNNTSDFLIYDGVGDWRI